MKTQVRRPPTRRRGKILTLIVWFLALFVCVPLLIFGNWFVTTFGTGSSSVALSQPNDTTTSDVHALSSNPGTDQINHGRDTTAESKDTVREISVASDGTNDTQARPAENDFQPSGGSEVDTYEGGDAPPIDDTASPRRVEATNTPTVSSPSVPVASLTVNEASAIPQLPATPETHFSTPIAAPPTDVLPPDVVPLSRQPLEIVPTIRIWKSRDGKEASAKFVRMDALTGKIVVENAQGREFRIPLNVLSDEDIAYVKSIQ